MCSGRSIVGPARPRPEITNSNSPSANPISHFSEYFHRKDQKKVDKLTSQIPYHEGRGDTEKATKIKEQIDSIWAKAREAQWA